MKKKRRRPIRQPRDIAPFIYAVTPENAAKRLELSLEETEALLDSGKLRSILINGKHRRVPLPALVVFLENEDRPAREDVKERSL